MDESQGGRETLQICNFFTQLCPPLPPPHTPRSPKCTGNMARSVTLDLIRADPDSRGVNAQQTWQLAQFLSFQSRNTRNSF